MPRLIDTPEMEKIREQIAPYLVVVGTDVTYKDETPQKIIDMHKELIHMSRQMHMQAVLA